MFCGKILYTVYETGKEDKDLSKKLFMKGNEAIGEAAIRSGVKAYYGYPITPQNELTAYMAKHMKEKRACVYPDGERKHGH